MLRLLRVLLVAFTVLPLRPFAVLAAPPDQTAVADTVPEADTAEVATITGRVYEEFGGYGIFGAKIILIDPDTPDQEIVGGVTDTSGFYTVTQPISNTWIIRIDPNSGSDYFVLLPEYYDNTYDIATATPVTAEVGKVVTGIDAAIAYQGQINGVVSDADTGDPIANVSVAAYEAVSGQIYNYGSTDSTGRYVVNTYHTGEYKLLFDPPDDSSYALEYYNNQITLGKSQPVTVGAERPLTVDVALGQGGVISGVVTSNWFNRFIYAPAVIVLDERGEQITTGYRYENPPGHYVVPNVPPGSYAVKFTASAHRPFLRTTPVTVVAGETTANINAQVPIVMQVTSIATSAALPGTIVLAFQHDPTPVVTYNGGMNWYTPRNLPWVQNADAFLYPDMFADARFSAGVAPRGAPGEGARLLMNVGRSYALPDDLRPGLYRSGDAGESWADSTIDPPLAGGSTCADVYYNMPVTTRRAPDHLYMLHVCTFAEYNRLLVSTNSGVTWQDVTTKDGRTLLLYPSASALIVPSPHVAGLLYVYDGSTQWYKSTNDGLDWTSVNFPVESFVFDGENANTLYGWTPRMGGPYHRDGKRSTDGGVTWQNWGENPCPYTFEEEPPQLVAHPTQGNILIMRCDNDLTDGLFRTTNGGDSWERITQANGQRITADLGVPGRILWAKDDGLWASTNNGDTWQPILQNYRIAGMPVYLPAIRGAE